MKTNTSASAHALSYNSAHTHIHQSLYAWTLAVLVYLFLSLGALAGCSGDANANKTDGESTGNSSSNVSTSSETSQASLGLVEDGKLTVVAELGFAPFESMDTQTGEPVGFDVDLMAAIAEKLGLELNYLPSQHFDTIVPTIQQGGRADVGVSGITINDQRLQQVAFSDPYIDSNQAVIVAKNSGETSESLNASNKQVAVQSGTTGEDWARENLSSATIVALDDVAVALSGLSTGLYQAVVVDLPVAENMLQNSFSDLSIEQEVPTGEQYGIAINKDNTALTNAINQALADIKSDGTYEQIYQKWFGAAV